MRRSSIPPAVFLIVLVAPALLAFDPSLPDALTGADPDARRRAYLSAAALPDADKSNLAAQLASRLSDPERGEMAAIALCRLGPAGVPHLVRHAHDDVAGSEFAAMGLLSGQNSSQEAFAELLRSPDPQTIATALAVIKASGLLPPPAAAELNRLVGGGGDWSAAALDALNAATAAREASDAPAANPEELFRMIESAELSAAIEAAAAGASTPTEAPAGPGSFEPREMDAAGFRTRQPASDSFSRNRPPEK